MLCRLSSEQHLEVPMSSMFMRPLLVAASLLALLPDAATAARKQVGAAQSLSLESVNGATWRRGNLAAPILLKLQVLLDRAHASPGQIDATQGENMRKAVAAFREMRRLGRGEQVDEQVWRALTEKDREPVLVRDLHASIAGQRVRRGSLMERILDDTRERLDPSTGVAAIGSLAGMAGTLGCDTETLRRYLQQLAKRRLIVKNDGNATSMLGRSGITVALDFPEGLREAIGPQPSPPTPDPPISEQTGKPIPQFHDEPGRNPSRSPYSHETRDDGRTNHQPIPLLRLRVGPS